MNEVQIEEKIGKIFSVIESLKGRIDSLNHTVFGNGLPGHEKRIGKVESDLTEYIKNRAETCPVLLAMRNEEKQKQVNWDRILLVITSFLNSGLIVYLMSGGRLS